MAVGACAGPGSRLRGPRVAALARRRAVSEAAGAVGRVG